mmetsp:Transcript_20304/g.60310  ORF Transcript_20304/g.60310 Transcript_20304/m.60310 type:complete len:216 (-) Transcript_20304:1186-1833(-)
MFGYFLRRVDKLFQLERTLGTIEADPADAVKRLEKLFAMADAEHPVDADVDGETSRSSETPSRSGADEGRNLPARKEKSALRRYVESFDQAAMVETARIVSLEAAALVERQTSGVLGDVKKLTKQIQDAVGRDVSSMEQVMERMAQAVEADRVETVTMTVGTQRRAVLEAVAFGAFMRDVETWVQTDYSLLTPLPPPSSSSSGGSIDDGDGMAPL